MLIKWEFPLCFTQVFMKSSTLKNKKSQVFNLEVVKWKIFQLIGKSYEHVIQCRMCILSSIDFEIPDLAPGIKLLVALASKIHRNISERVTLYVYSEFIGESMELVRKYIFHVHVLLFLFFIRFFP